MHGSLSEAEQQLSKHRYRLRCGVTLLTNSGGTASCAAIGGTSSSTSSFTKPSSKLSKSSFVLASAPSSKSLKSSPKSPSAVGVFSDEFRRALDRKNGLSGVGDPDLGQSSS